MKKRIIALMGILLISLNTYGFNIFKKCPVEIVEAIGKEAQNLPFAADATLKEKWIDTQKNAYLELQEQKLASKIPEDVMYEIVKCGEKKFGVQYFKQLEFFNKECDAYNDLKSNTDSYGGEQLSKIKNIWKRFEIDEYTVKNRDLPLWNSFFSNPYSGRIKEEILNSILEKSLAISKGNPRDASNYMHAMCSARIAFEIYTIRDVPLEKIIAARAKIEREFPKDFKRQLAEIKKLKTGDFFKLKSNFDLSKLVFIRSTGNDGTHIGLLVKFKDKAFIICNKHFVPDRLPIRISNQHANLTCSSIVVSKYFKFIGLVVDDIPADFGDIPSVSSFDEFDKIDDLSLVLYSFNGTFRTSVLFNTMDSMRQFNVTSVDEAAWDLKNSKRTTLLGFNFTRGKTISVPKNLSHTVGGIILNSKGNICAISTLPFIPDFTKNDFSITLNMLTQKKQDTFDSGKFYKEYFQREDVMQFVSLKDLFESGWEAFDLRRYFKSEELIRRCANLNTDGAIMINQKFDLKFALETQSFSPEAARYKFQLESISASPSGYTKTFRMYIFDINKKLLTYLPKFESNLFFALNRDYYSFQKSLNQNLRDYIAEMLRLSSGADSDMSGMMSGTQKATYRHLQNKVRRL